MGFKLKRSPGAIRARLCALDPRARADDFNHNAEIARMNMEDEHHRRATRTDPVDLGIIGESLKMNREIQHAQRIEEAKFEATLEPRPLIPNITDGHNRRAVAASLGMDPVDMVYGVSRKDTGVVPTHVVIIKSRSRRAPSHLTFAEPLNEIQRPITLLSVPVALADMYQEGLAGAVAFLTSTRMPGTVATVLNDPDAIADAINCARHWAKRRGEHVVIIDRDKGLIGFETPMPFERPGTNVHGKLYIVPVRFDPEP